MARFGAINIPPDTAEGSWRHYGTFVFALYLRGSRLAFLENKKMRKMGYAVMYSGKIGGIFMKKTDAIRATSGYGFLDRNGKVLPVAIYISHNDFTDSKRSI